MEQFKQNLAYQQMEPQKQRMIEELMRSLYGKQLGEVIPIISNWKNKMREQGLTFTEAENAMLTDIFMAQMTPAQKKQYELLKNFMNKTKKH